MAFEGNLGQTSPFLLVLAIDWLWERVLQTISPRLSPEVFDEVSYCRYRAR